VVIMLDSPPKAVSSPCILATARGFACLKESRGLWPDCRAQSLLAALYASGTLTKVNCKSKR
jgi:hypothetical protein